MQSTYSLLFFGCLNMDNGSSSCVKVLYSACDSVSAFNEVVSSNWDQSPQMVPRRWYKHCCQRCFLLLHSHLVHSIWSLQCSNLKEFTYWGSWFEIGAGLLCHWTLNCFQMMITLVMCRTYILFPFITMAFIKGVLYHRLPQMCERQMEWSRTAF